MTAAENRPFCGSKQCFCHILRLGDPDCRGAG
jgi:hypothetical protein